MKPRHGILPRMKFGRLLVKRIIFPPADGKNLFCLCDCGKSLLAKSSAVKSGHTTSCGCFMREGLIKRITKHGRATRINGKPDATYTTWLKMRDRCLNPKNRFYQRYGGRGISVCPRWEHSFCEFLKDMGPRPKGKTIGRIDNNGDYCPENTRWETPAQQAANTSRNVYLKLGDKAQTIKQWANDLGVRPNLLTCRRLKGWSDRDVLLTPICRGGKRYPVPKSAEQLSLIA